MSHWVLIAVVVGIVVLAALSCFLNYLVTGKGTVSGTDVAASRVTPPLFSLIPVLLFAVLFGSFPFTKVSRAGSSGCTATRAASRCRANVNSGV
jgi:hypothetical protein